MTMGQLEAVTAALLMKVEKIKDCYSSAMKITWWNILKNMGKNLYLAGANKVVSSSNVLHKTEAEDGDDVYYLEETNEFVIVSTDGYIRTYFKPEDGIDYYNRQ